MHQVSTASWVPPEAVLTYYRQGGVLGVLVLYQSGVCALKLLPSGDFRYCCSTVILMPHTVPRSCLSPLTFREFAVGLACEYSPTPLLPLLAHNRNWPQQQNQRRHEFAHRIRLIFASDITGLQQRIQFLPCVTGVLGTISRTHRDALVFENVLLKHDTFR